MQDNLTSFILSSECLNFEFRWFLKILDHPSHLFSTNRAHTVDMYNHALMSKNRVQCLFLSIRSKSNLIDEMSGKKSKCGFILNHNNLPKSIKFNWILQFLSLSLFFTVRSHLLIVFVYGTLFTVNDWHYTTILLLKFQWTNKNNNLWWNDGMRTRSFYVIDKSAIGRKKERKGA